LWGESPEEVGWSPNRVPQIKIRVMIGRLWHETLVRTIVVKRQTLGVNLRDSDCAMHSALAGTVDLFSQWMFLREDKDSIRAILITSSGVRHYSNIKVLSLRTSLRKPILSLECQYLSLCWQCSV